MPKFSIVVMLPEQSKDRLDFVHREFESIEDITKLMIELETVYPNWRLVSFCHVEDLPLMMEYPNA